MVRDEVISQVSTCPFPIGSSYSIGREQAEDMPNYGKVYYNLQTRWIQWTTCELVLVISVLYFGKGPRWPFWYHYQLEPYIQHSSKCFYSSFSELPLSSKWQEVSCSLRESLPCTLTVALRVPSKWYLL